MLEKLRNPSIDRSRFRMLGVVVAVVCVTALGLSNLPAQPNGHAGPSGQAPDNKRLEQARLMLEQSTVPVGGIIAYFGAHDEITRLESWELCDGTAVSTKQSPLHGVTKPDLSDRFIIGTTAEIDLRKQPIAGGNNQTPALGLGGTHGHALSVQEMPGHHHSHAHYVAHNSGANGPRMLDDNAPGGHLRTKGQAGKDSKYVLIGGGGTPNAGPTNNSGPHAGGGAAHSHGLPNVPAHDNRPAFAGLFYIIRVK